MIDMYTFGLLSSLGVQTPLSTWMIVEDEPDIYALLLAMFDVWGIEGIAFVDGDETMGWIADVDSGLPVREVPELALLDVRLPGEISGMHIGARLRESPVLQDVVIVLITAFRLSPTDEAFIQSEAGADIFLYKPLPDLAKLRLMLDEAIHKRRLAREIAARPQQTQTPESPTLPKPASNEAQARPPQSTSASSSSHDSANHPLHSEN